MMKFRFITPKDPEYADELMLRWEALAKPLGLPPGMEEKKEEEKSLHLIALDRKKLVGCVLFLPESKTQGRLSEMAVSEEYRGKGFGRKLIAMLEEALQGKGVQEISLFSPSELIRFYEGMGYTNTGDPVKKNGVFLQPMRKTL